jgi:riboflavin synthase
MFTGIIKSIGRVASIEARSRDARVRILAAELEPATWAEGASVAVNGVCLTAVSIGSDHFEADISEHTLNVTTLGGLSAGAPVNLEPALRLGDALDGHWVTGHVDAAGTVGHIADASGSWRLRIAVPAELGRYIARKGSVAVDGVSLTINSIGEDWFEVTIIPHTQTATIIQHYGIGTAVNIEVDIVARYMERLLLHSN